jgi:hypothetical protein
MVAPEQAPPKPVAPLAASVQTSNREEAVKSGSFLDAVDAEADKFFNSPPKKRTEFANFWFDNEIGQKPEFQALPEEEKQQTRLKFYQDHSDLGLGTLQFDDPLEAVSAGLQTVLNAGNTFFNPLQQGLTLGMAAPNVQGDLKYQQSQFPGIDTDPGLLGQSYRALQNPLSNIASGAASIAGNTIGSFAPASQINKLLGGLKVMANPLTRQLATGAIQSGVNNASDVAYGRQSLQQAGTNFLGDTATNVLGMKLAGGSRLASAGIQGLGGGVTGYSAGKLGGLNDKQALEQALIQGAQGAGFGAVFPDGQPLVPRRAVKPRDLRTDNRFMPGAQFTQNAPTFRKAYPVFQGTETQYNIRNAIWKELKSADSIQGVDMPATWRKRRDAHKKLYEKLANLPNGGDPVLQKDIQQAMDKAKSNYDGYDQSLKATTKTAQTQAVNASKKTLTPQQVNQIAERAVKLLNQAGNGGNPNAKSRAEIKATLNNYLEKYSKESRKAVGLRIGGLLDQQKASTLRDAEVSKAQKEARQKTAKSFKQSQKDEAKSQKTAQTSKKTPEQSKTEVENTRKKASELGHEAAQSEAGKVKLIQRAKDKGETVLIEYRAQKSGESEGANFKYKRDTVIEGPHRNKQGIEQIRVINNEGQIRTRFMNDPESGSQIVSVTRTDEPAPYRYEDGKVLDNEGNIIEQTIQGMVKSTEIEAAIEQDPAVFKSLMRQYAKKQGVKVKDLMNSASTLDDASLTKTLKDAPHEVNDKLHQDQTGRPCG